MDAPAIRVVGLGPAGPELVTPQARELIARASTARLRTRRHPAAADLDAIPSYDDLYERADSFEDLYVQIAGDLVRLARQSGDGPVVYAVPGSPVVAERTVEILLATPGLTVTLDPAVSVIDVACAVLGRDPMAVGLRVLDALAWPEEQTGGGSLLVLQAYSPEVLAVLGSRLSRDDEVVVLHHLGLADQRVERTTAGRLVDFTAADHLTSLWVEPRRTADAAVGRLVALTRTLRERCVWDSEQTHQSLTRHLLEESYEALDALEAYADEDQPSAQQLHDVVEELGDLLFQIVFHAEIGSEDGRFDLAAIADSLCDKLVARHPHVFAGVEVVDADDAARRWEVLKRAEKGRASVTEGIPLQMPALTLYAKLRRKAVLAGMPLDPGALARERALTALARLNVAPEPASDGSIEVSRDDEWADLLEALGDLARWAGVDLESVLRARALELRERIIEHESAGHRHPEDGELA